MIEAKRRGRPRKYPVQEKPKKAPRNFAPEAGYKSLGRAIILQAVTDYVQSREKGYIKNKGGAAIFNDEVSEWLVSRQAHIYACGGDMRAIRDAIYRKYGKPYAGHISKYKANDKSGLKWEKAHDAMIWECERRFLVRCVNSSKGKKWYIFADKKSGHMSTHDSFSEAKRQAMLILDREGR